MTIACVIIETSEASLSNSEGLMHFKFNLIIHVAFFYPCMIILFNFKMCSFYPLLKFRVTSAGSEVVTIKVLIRPRTRYMIFCQNWLLGCRAWKYALSHHQGCHLLSVIWSELLNILASQFIFLFCFILCYKVSHCGSGWPDTHYVI